MTSRGLAEAPVPLLLRFRYASSPVRIGEEVTSGGVSRLAAEALEFFEGLEADNSKGYPKDHPRIELVRYKGLVAWQDWPAGPWLGTRRAKDRVVNFLRLSRPLSGWLRENVGLSISSSPIGQRS